MWRIKRQLYSVQYTTNFCSINILFQYHYIGLLILVIAKKLTTSYKPISLTTKKTHYKSLTSRFIYYFNFYNFSFILNTPGIDDFVNTREPCPTVSF